MPPGRPGRRRDPRAEKDSSVSRLPTGAPPSPSFGGQAECTNVRRVRPGTAPGARYAPSNRRMSPPSEGFVHTRRWRSRSLLGPRRRVPRAGRNRNGSFWSADPLRVAPRRRAPACDAHRLHLRGLRRSRRDAEARTVVREAGFRAFRVSPERKLRKHFGCEMRFDALRCHRSGAATGKLRGVTRHPPTWGSALRHGICGDRPAVGKVAKSLGMSPRTLQRRLKAARDHVPNGSLVQR